MAEIEQQVVDLARGMKPPADWKPHAVEAMDDVLGDQKPIKRVAQMRR